MEFGVFDHLDRSDLPLRAFYQARLDVIEAYDRAGFYAYHVAEHHATPLGMAPSPSVFLAAIAERTERLRFGPLVYALPLHHPLRLAEEICMLDHLSGGRLELGFGRGSSPIEVRLYGQNPEDAQRIYAEGMELIIQALTQKTLNFQGEFFSFEDVPMEIEPLQKPHPPIWYGVHSPESAERAALKALNIVSLDTAADTRVVTDHFRQVWRESHGEAELPRIGLCRFVFVAESDEAALDAVRRAYPVWHRSFNHLFKLYGSAPRHPRPPDFDGLSAIGLGVAGTPETVTEFLTSEMTAAGAGYFVGQFAFGDLTLPETLRSVELFASEVMPALAGT
ncbi:MAG: LLM class flavin-dependent oxidoreductase [Alphaproteobacteria bacterium]